MTAMVSPAIVMSMTPTPTVVMAPSAAMTPAMPVAFKLYEGTLNRQGTLGLRQAWPTLKGLDPVQ